MRAVLVCFCLLFAVCDLSLAQGGAMNKPVPTVVPSYVTKAPVIDGALGDSAWQGASKAGDFRCRDSGEPAAQRTDVHLCYDRSTLFLAFECFESRMDKLKPKYTSDGDPVWQDDSIEVFISPNSVADAGRCYQFVVNAAGAKAALRPLGTPLNLPWRAAVTRLGDRWVAEIAIPFDALRPLGTNASCWRANLCRNDNQRGEMTSWSFVPRWYATYSRFGKLVPPGAEFKFCTFRGDPVALERDAAGATGRQPVSAKTISLNTPDCIIPQPQSVVNRPRKEPFRITPDTKIVIDDDAVEEDLWTVEEINETIEKLGGKPLPVVHSMGVGSAPENAANSIVIGENSRNRLLRAVCERDSVRLPEAKQANTAYALDVMPDRIVVSGASVLGTYYGAQTLKQLFKRRADGSISVASTSIRDYAGLGFRGVHLLTAHDALSYTSKLIENLLAPMKINHIVLQTDKIAWKCFPEIIDKSNFMPAEDVPKLLEVARQHHIAVTPLVQSPGHLEWAFLGGKNLGFAEDPERPYCYCMTNPKSYEFIFSVMDEAIELFGNPEYFHAGRDEFDMEGRMPHDERCLAIGKEKLYLQDTIKIHEHLKSKGCKMMMWGDVLTKPGYKEEVDQLPRDILINDWRYTPAETYPTVDFYQSHGFPVVGGTWYSLANISTFSQYAAKKGIEGMLQTTWTGWSSEEVTLKNYPDQVYAYILSAAWSWNPQSPSLGDLPYRPDAVFRKLWSAEPLDSRVSYSPVRLDRFFNISRVDSSHKMGWLGMGKGNDLGGLPAGTIEIEGTPFAIAPRKIDKPAAVMLGGKALPGSFPRLVEGISVDAVAAALNFLHGCAYASDKDSEVGKYIVHYEDGKTEQIPLVYSANIHAWDDQTTATSYGFAWRGRAADGRVVGISDLRWLNPRPGVKITCIDFLAGDTEASPFLLALTAEHPVLD